MAVTIIGWFSEDQLFFFIGTYLVVLIDFARKLHAGQF
jgi:hypothetical protein